MTDFTHAINEKCPHCGASFCREEGYNCDCMMPRFMVRFKGEEYEVSENVYEEIQKLNDLLYNKWQLAPEWIEPDEWVEQVQELLIDEGLIQRPEKENP